jgi:hypothetical protein
MSFPPVPAADKLPRPIGTPSLNDVPQVSQVSPLQLEWGTGGGGGGGNVDSVTATDASIVVAGTADNPTVATGTLDVIAAQHPPAANWSNNSKKITSLANGSGAQDAAAFGQIPASAATIGGLLAANNLSDLASASTARTNLGLGAAALLATPIPGADLPSASTSAAGIIEIDGTATDIASTGPQAAGSIGKAADAGHVHFSSGQYLCPPTAYAPGSQTVLTTTSATLAAVSSANVNTGSFVAPASGKVMITVFLIGENSGGDATSYALAAHGTVTPVVGNTITWTEAGSLRPRLLKFLVTGLTAGSSYNFDLLWAVAGGTGQIDALGGTSTTPTGTNGAPVTMEVQAV